MSAPRLSRRTLFATAGAAAAPSLGVAPAAPAAPGGTHGSLGDKDHVIVLMKENRSFDHYFGTLAGVRGYGDPSGEAIFHQPDPAAPGGVRLPFHLDTRRTAAQRLPDLEHSRRSQHAALARGRMNGWLASLRREGDDAGFTMGYLRRADLPLYSTLADAFTVCDGYHAALLGPTHPNRIMMMTGTVDGAGKYGRAALDNRGRNYTWETYPERLERAGISWLVHHEADDFGCNVLKYFAQYRLATPGQPLHDKAMRNQDFSALLDDLRRGNIPQVLFVIPPAAASEHPSYLPAEGEHYTARLLAALWSNPKLWARTAVILNWDENDGLFDHVAPPQPEPGTADEWVDGKSLGPGFRVPCLVISPWSAASPGELSPVCGRVFDHTSVLRLLETRFGVEAPLISQWRRQVTGDLSECFDFTRPARLQPPTLPDTAAALEAAERAIRDLPKPRVLAMTELPKQEAGVRRRVG
jgi:phospholipase C